jgi:hypothetical protein
MIGWYLKIGHDGGGSIFIADLPSSLSLATDTAGPAVHGALPACGKRLILSSSRKFSFG